MSCYFSIQLHLSFAISYTHNLLCWCLTLIASRLLSRLHHFSFAQSTSTSPKTLLIDDYIQFSSNSVFVNSYLQIIRVITYRCFTYIFISRLFFNLEMSNITQMNFRQLENSFTRFHENNVQTTKYIYILIINYFLNKKLKISPKYSDYGTNRSS